MKKVIATIKRLTNRNYHTEAVIQLANFLSDIEAREKLLVISKKMDAQGFINEELATERYNILVTLLGKIKSIYGTSVYNDFYQSF